MNRGRALRGAGSDEPDENAKWISSITNPARCFLAAIAFDALVFHEQTPLPSLAARGAQNQQLGMTV